MGGVGSAGLFPARGFVWAPAPRLISWSPALGIHISTPRTGGPLHPPHPPHRLPGDPLFWGGWATTHFNGGPRSAPPLAPTRRLSPPTLCGEAAGRRGGVEWGPSAGRADMDAPRRAPRDQAWGRTQTKPRAGTKPHGIPPLLPAASPPEPRRSPSGRLPPWPPHRHERRILQRLRRASHRRAHRIAPGWRPPRDIDEIIHPRDGRRVVRAD